MIERTIKTTLGITGEATFEFSSGKRLRQKNTVTNIGLSEIVYAMLDKNLPLFYIAVGDDDANVTPNQIALQTALEGEIQRLDPTSPRQVNQDIDLDYLFTMFSQFGGTTTSPIVGQTVREVGLFNRFLSGDMFARAKTAAAFTMDVQSNFDSTWRIKVGTGGIAANGGIVHSGSKLVCDALKRQDPFVDNENNYYNGAPSNELFTPHPWGINLISLGTNGLPTDPKDLDLKAPETDFDTPPTITNLDLTDEATDVNYEAKIIIQKYIPPNSVPFEIKEAGLFNSRERLTIADSQNIETVRTMFSRVPVEPSIAANAEAVLNWEIGFKRG